MPSLGLISKHPRPFNGVLEKKGHLMKTWKRRDFTLDGNTLSYFDRGSSKGSYLVDSTSRVSKTGDMEDHSCCFTLSTTKGDLVMSAPDSASRDVWIAVIQETINGGPLVDIPDVLAGSFNATVPLAVTFPSGAVASDGNILTPAQVRRPPVVAFKPPGGSSGGPRMYSLIMIDPDAPSRAEPMYREFVHWAVVNMPGCDVTAGETVAPYFGAAPPHNSGFHRYFLFLYEQPSPLSPGEVGTLMDYFVRRGGFTLVRWAAKMGFGYPVGVEGFQSTWDEFVDELHNEMRFMPPPQYRSPAQERAMAEFSAMEQRLKAEQELATACTRGEEHLAALGLADFFPTPLGTGAPPPKPAGVSVPVYLKIKYAQDKFVYKGHRLNPADTAGQPEVSCREYLQADKLYSLVMTDPDAPSRDDPSLREYVHWAVVNIPGSVHTNVTAAGSVVLPYRGPAPPYNTGMHRYIFMLFEQQRGRMDAAAVAASRDFFAPRSGLSTSTWVKKMLASAETGDAGATDASRVYPVGINGFTAEWDHSVDEAHRAVGYVPPAKYRSPAQQAGGGSLSGRGGLFKGLSVSGSIGSSSSSSAHPSTPISDELRRLMTAHPAVFLGALVTKKSDRDATSKKRWVWVDAATKTLNWAKSEATSSSAKNVLLVGCTSVTVTPAPGGATAVLRVMPKGTDEGVELADLAPDVAAQYKVVVMCIASGAGSEAADAAAK